MSDYNWCHNPSCHEIETQSRIRGTGDNKVLRTRKISLNSEWVRESIYAYFCNQSCLYQFLNKFKNEIANIRPVKQPSEKPIIVEKTKEQCDRYNYRTDRSEPFMATRTTISLK